MTEGGLRSLIHLMHILYQSTLCVSSSRALHVTVSVLYRLEYHFTIHEKDSVCGHHQRKLIASHIQA